MANGYNPFQNIGAGVNLPRQLLTMEEVEGMYGQGFDVGAMPVFDPQAPKFGEGFIKAEDILGEGVNAEFAGGGAFINMGPNAITSAGSVDPLFEQIGIRRNVAFDPFAGTHGAGGAFFSEQAETRRAFEELGLGRGFKQMGFESEQAQQEAFSRTLEAGDAFGAQSFFDAGKLQQEYTTNLDAAWEGAADRLFKAGREGLNTIFADLQNTPALAEVHDSFWPRFEAAYQAGGGTFEKREAGAFGAPLVNAKSAGEWLRHHLGGREPEDILPNQLDVSAMENFQQQFQQQAPQALLSYDARGQAGVLGGLGGFAPPEDFGFDQFYGHGGGLQGGYY
jgi:hypothetical protein